jgi:hypothetical protein
MDLQILERFFFWSMVVNAGIYTLSAIAVVALRGFVYKVHQKLFGLDEDAVAKAVVNYLGNYKLLITVFNFTPWIAILIVK